MIIPLTFPTVPRASATDTVFYTPVASTGNGIQSGGSWLYDPRNLSNSAPSQLTTTPGIQSQLPFITFTGFQVLKPAKLVRIFLPYLYIAYMNGNISSNYDVLVTGSVGGTNAFVQQDTLEANYSTQGAAATVPTFYLQGYVSQTIDLDVRQGEALKISFLLASPYATLNVFLTTGVIADQSGWTAAQQLGVQPLPGFVHLDQDFRRNS